MAKVSMVQRDIKRNLLFKRYQNRRKKIKSKIKTAKTFNEQLYAQAKLQDLPRNSATVRIRNRCWLTGRSRGYFRMFGLSRHTIREMAHNGLIPGLKKSSW
uniref:Small ribosomal subunit protein uS14c n=1 Tax=Neogoniolithon spectabile TaxID=231755 RepID=A0A3G3MGX1_9FLOR|nr:ribosomal protein S14 [Neogoniolithon spectabile]AYR06042.1 ribosomal protein S14 [Neogoniolithon spectabile]